MIVWTTLLQTLDARDNLLDARPMVGQHHLAIDDLKKVKREPAQQGAAQQALQRRGSVWLGAALLVAGDG